MLIVSFVVVSNYFEDKNDISKTVQVVLFFSRAFWPGLAAAGVRGGLRRLIALLSSAAQLANLPGPSVHPKVSEHQGALQKRSVCS